MVAVFWDVLPCSLVHVYVSEDLAASTFIVDTVSYLYSLRTNIIWSVQDSMFDPAWPN